MKKIEEISTSTTHILSPAEQEYLRQIYLFDDGKHHNITTKILAAVLNNRASSVTAMIKKLSIKQMVVYDKHFGCRLSENGLKEALQIIRRNRLWELFLYEKLALDWEQVNEMASKLQSLTSTQLIEKLAVFLGNPTYDLQGEVIPDLLGELPATSCLEIYDLKVGQKATVFGYRETSNSFLEYIGKLNLQIGAQITILCIVTYNSSIEIIIENNQTYILSKEIAQKIFVHVDPN